MMRQQKPHRSNHPLPRTALGQLFTDQWGSRSQPVVRCIAFDRCATQDQKCLFNVKAKLCGCLLALGLGVGLSQYQSKSHTKHHIQQGRSTIVHLFEWRWNDIAEECERYLGPNGFDGVQISPPSENVVVTKPWRPWWERYQPVSYNLCSRSGTQQELRDMVCRCNNVGVKIYADVVINHMCMSGAGEGEGRRRSTCGSYFNASKREFPSVPYSASHFNDDKCTTSSRNIETYQDIYQVRNCRLLGLLDLAQDKEHVRERIVDYMNRLVDMGIAGFRVDACKHMWPEDLKNIYSRLHNLNTTWFTQGSRPLIYQEIIDLGGEPIKATEYSGLGLVTEFKYGTMLGSVIRKWNQGKLSDLKTCGESWDLLPSGEALVFVDNHDNQRGHGAGGASILTFWEPRNMVMFRNVVDGEPLSNWWDNGGNQIAFGRGNQGFIVINNDNCSLDVMLYTGLHGGTYCDVISGQRSGGRCSGKQVTVGGDGRAHFTISPSDPDPVIAIHTHSKLE
ncbi:pancreatic alpha-amylase-like isoform X4 [Salvelinus namaycush]|uniref:Alpha-amylase n=1 Tax=Salvelinus namaycush TaxID=8040 RepID=A0A8U0PR64_SALNM|nr:pancreatic alpha-amylase-like isoform X4 [Salvelinus namaycush]